MDTAETLGKIVPVKQACEALAVSRASLYRRRSARCEKTTEAPRDKRKSNPSHRGLSSKQRTDVVDALHSERFMDQSPREVYATLLDEGTYLCSGRKNGPITTCT